MTDGIPGDELESREDAKRPVERLVMLPDDAELVELVKYLIANIGHPVGMGMEPTDKQAETIISLVRKFDSEHKNDLLSALKVARNEIYYGGFEAGWNITRLDDVIKAHSAT